MSGWLLQQIAIEGFRGINNEGTPLALKLKPNCVNSVSAPNGVGKSSIFNAVVYAITGEIPKLEELPAAEKGSSYYLNRFHSGDVGTVALTLVPAAGGQAVTVTVTRNVDGVRTVAADHDIDGDALLAELNREFVLLDGKTFQDFIDLKPLDRGRSFAGLLGLRRYSLLRQALLTASNTRALNNHYGTATKKSQRDAALLAVTRARANIKEAYQALVGEVLDPALGEETLLARAHSALHGIELLKPHCDGKAFEEIDPSACVEAAKAAEGGEDREKLANLLREEARWKDTKAALPDAEARATLASLAEARDTALENTQGDLFQQLYAVSDQILSDDSWSDKAICPACDRAGDSSVLDHVQQKIGVFEAVTTAAANIAGAWTGSGWPQLKALEALAAEAQDPRLFAAKERDAERGQLSTADVSAMTDWAATLKARADAKLSDLDAAKLALEKTLPPKLTAVVEKAEAARRLQANLEDGRTNAAVAARRNDELARIERVKSFLDEACKRFAEAESRAARRRLAAIEPKCRAFFAAIMHEDVVPALSKREGSEEIALSLEEFWTLGNVSAQALLSESFRNAFAVSVYLAAASLYASGARFLILDDVTSSFDSGHQFHLMKVIRDQFARPGVQDGPQVILLSHDTALEKLFNTNSNGGNWWHQCIQGTPRTAVLPQSGAVHKIKDATIGFLDAGNTEDAAPRIRQYLEFKLEEVINRVAIPVPMTIAFNDDKHMAQNLIDAIKQAVALHGAAGSLILEPGQRAGMNTAVATIVGNYVSHWATGHTHAFTAGSLKGVMKAIDDFAACFEFEHPPGSGHKRYYKSLSQKL